MTQQRFKKWKSKQDFSKFILKWYQKNKRDLPWRNTTDPYKILVSEIMLQQTQVDRVIPKYHAFLQAFPTVAALAQASQARLLQLWSGLGYNSRALRLQKCAQQIVALGAFPQERDDLLTLPGIGPYTSASVLIFAFNQDIATVDTNIRRIFIAEFGLDESITDKELFVFAQDCLPKGKSREWHNALMDYGSLVCTAKKTGIKPKTRQSTFKGSRRQFRGDVIKRLVHGQQLTVSFLTKEWKKDILWVEELLISLEKEGLLCKDADKVYLQQENP